MGYTLAFAATAAREGSVPLTVAFLSTTRGATRLRWDFDGDGATDLTTTAALDATQAVTHTYGAAGTFGVRLVADGGPGTEADALLRDAYVTARFEPPVASFTASPLFGRPPLTVQLDDTSTGAASWAWDFTSDGIVDSTLRSTSHTFTLPGTYTVRLTVANAAAARAATAVIRVLTPPIARFVAVPTTGPTPLAVLFDDRSTGATAWAWDFEDDSVTDSTVERPAFTYTVDAARTFTARLTVTNEVDTDSVTAAIDVFPPAEGDLDGDGIVTALDVQRAVNMVRGLTAPDLEADVDFTLRVDAGDIPRLAEIAAGVPMIRSIEPGGGAPGDVITIRGGNFGTDPALLVVQFGGVPARILSVNRDRMQVEIPPFAQTGGVTVKRTFQARTSISLTFAVFR